MKKLFSQSKVIILIVKDFQVQLLLWEDKTLSLIEHYSDFQGGREHLEKFLEARLDYPLIIVNDVIEESFRNETAVHVSANDRRALLERKLSYSFRNTSYRAARITGREASGRRDDTVMLSAITKPELVNPWVDLVLSKKIAVQSVNSVAFLTERYLAKFESKSPEHLMIISAEDGTSLRQTFLKQGRVLFSRLTTLPSSDPVTIGASIYQESLQIRQYLERIKLLSYDTPLEIRVFTPNKKESLGQSLTSSKLNTFEYFDTRDEATSLDIELKGLVPSALYVFLTQVLKKSRIENVYANFNVRRYFYLKAISQGLALAASAIVVLAMLINTPTISDMLDKNNLIDIVETQTVPLRQEYQRLTQRFPETPIDSKEMALVVETFETIQQQSHTPMQAMSFISQALAQSPDLQISRIDWNMVENSLGATDNQGFLGYTPPQTAVPGMEFTQAVLDNRTRLQVIVEGVAYSPSSYRDAQNQVQNFISALENIPGVSVEPLKMPTEVRVDTQVVTTVGDSELRSSFVLQVKVESVP